MVYNLFGCASEVMHHILEPRRGFPSHESIRYRANHDQNRSGNPTLLKRGIPIPGFLHILCIYKYQNDFNGHYEHNRHVEKLKIKVYPKLASNTCEPPRRKDGLHGTVWTTYSVWLLTHL